MRRGHTLFLQDWRMGRPQQLSCNHSRPVLSGLFAMVLEARLSVWAESRGIRADDQAGSRKGHRTVDQAFTLRTLVTQAKQRKKSSFCCFVDFSEAFDFSRERLWQVLAGLVGPLLQYLQGMLKIVLASERKFGVLPLHSRCRTGMPR